MDDVFWLQWLRRAKPSYDDLTLFLMALTAAILLVRDEPLRALIRYSLNPAEPQSVVIVMSCLAFLMAGATFSLCTVYLANVNCGVERLATMPFSSSCGT